MTEVTDQGRGWRNAIRLLLEQNLTYGHLLTHDWLFEAFEIEQPKDDTPYKEAQKLQLRFVADFERFRAELLDEYQMDAQSVTGKGYMIVHPRDQTRRAEQDFQHEFKKFGRKAAARLAGVNHSMLSARERQENADAIARMSNLRAMVRKEFPKLPPMEETE
jgi:hypothetical protein